MKKFSKILSIVLTLSITLSSIFILNTKDSYAYSKKYVDNARSGVTYSYDLDQNGKKEKILCFIYTDEYGGYALDIYINNKLVKTYDELEDIPCMSIYDFNKNDNSLDIYIELVHESMYVDCHILKYNKGNIKDYCFDGGLDSFDSNTGKIKLGQYFPSSNDKFIRSIGGYGVKVPYKVTKTSVKIISSSTYSVTSCVRNHKYIASKNLTAYKTTSGKTKNFTIKKGAKFNIVALYKNGKKEYIKVKNSSGKYGYIKTQSTPIVTNGFYVS